MSRQLPLVYLALTASGLLGCASASNPDPLQPTMLPDSGLSSLQPNPAGGSYAFQAGAWKIHLDPENLSAAVEGLETTRSGQFNGDLFGLAIDQFFGGDALTVTDVRINGDLRLELDCAIAHPFPAPTNLDGPATAGNRADLGVCGEFLIRAELPASLVTNENQPNHTGDYEFSVAGAPLMLNPKLIVNADGYDNFGDCVTDGPTRFGNSGTAVHPYLVLVDESDPQRRTNILDEAAIPNVAGSQGNYDPSTGWSALNIGSQGNDWVGYGVLHQGQATHLTLEIDLDELQQISFGGNYALETALYARYTDPRQGENGAQLRAHRLPTDNPADFAYRMPFGALDVATIRQVGDAIIGPAINDTTVLTVAIVDEDHAATVNAEFPRPNGAGLQEIPASSAVTSVTLSCPDLGISDLAGTIGAGTGTVTDPLLVSFLVTNNTGSTGGFDQINHAVISVVDASWVDETDTILYLGPDLLPLEAAKEKPKEKAVKYKTGHITLIK